MDYYMILQSRYQDMKQSLSPEAQKLIEELLKDYVDAVDIILTLDTALNQSSDELKQAKALIKSLIQDKL